MVKFKVKTVGIWIVYSLIGVSGQNGSYDRLRKLELRYWMGHLTSGILRRESENLRTWELSLV